VVYVDPVAIGGLGEPGAVEAAGRSVAARVGPPLARRCMSGRSKTDRFRFTVSQGRARRCGAPDGGLISPRVQDRSSILHCRRARPRARQRSCAGVDRACRGNGRCGEFARPQTCFIPKGARRLTEMTIDEQTAYSSNVAAEAVGERLGNPPPDTREQTPRPAAASAGPRARLADKTVESLGREVRRCLRGRHDGRSAGAVAESFSACSNRDRVSDGRRGFIRVARPTDLCHGPRSLRPRLVFRGSLISESRGRPRIGRRCCCRGPASGPVRDVEAALAGTGVRWGQHRERNVPLEWTAPLPWWAFWLSPSYALIWVRNWEVLSLS
jgi:hypothetical protein